MKKIIVFNGPPRSGKDTASEIICSHYSNSAILKFTEIVKNKTHESLGLVCAHDFFEKDKDLKLSIFKNLTPRQAYINMSEQLRNEFGQNAIADIFVEKFHNLTEQLIVNPDIGFQFEADVLLNNLDHKNILFIKLMRNGKTFENDCRNWVNMDPCKTVTVYNDTKSQLEKDILSIVNDFLK